MLFLGKYIRLTAITYPILFNIFVSIEIEHTVLVKRFTTNKQVIFSVDKTLILLTLYAHARVGKYSGRG